MNPGFGKGRSRASGILHHKSWTLGHMEVKVGQDFKLKPSLELAFFDKSSVKGQGCKGDENAAWLTVQAWEVRSKRYHNR